jgi:hypothetical protein
MRRSISNLFDDDSDVRWTLMRRTMVFTVAFGAVLMLASFSIQVVSIWTCLAGTVAYFGQVIAYCRGKQFRSSSRTVHKYGIASRVTAFAFVGILALIMYDSSAPVQAAVINWKLASIHENMQVKPQMVSKQLHGIASAITVAREQRIFIKPELENRVRAALIESNSDSPGYWSAAGALVSYQSPPPRVLPNCFETTPKHLTWKELGAQPHLSIPPPPDQVTYSACRLDLDSYISASEFKVETPTNEVSIVCQSCDVVYSGGPLPIANAKGFVNLIFNDCSFTLKAFDDSPRGAKSLISEILRAADPKHISYVAAGSVIHTAGGDQVIER